MGLLLFWVFGWFGSGICWLVCEPHPPLVLVCNLPVLHIFKDMSDHFHFSNQSHIFWHECQFFLITGINYLLYTFKGLICITDTFFFGVRVIELLDMVNLCRIIWRSRVHIGILVFVPYRLEKDLGFLYVFYFLLICDHSYIFGEILRCLWLASLPWRLEYCLIFIGLRSGSIPRWDKLTGGYHNYP